MQKALLVLDLDETLLHAVESPFPKREPDFYASDYAIYKRPHVDSFLTRVWKVFDVAVWSKGGSSYVEPCVEVLMKDHPEPVFVWSFQRCTRRFDHESHDAYHIKDLKKVVKRGFNKERILIVDDLEINAERNYGSAIYIKPFEGEVDDDELLHLADYLESLAHEPNFRVIEKRFWRSGN